MKEVHDPPVDNIELRRRVSELEAQLDSAQAATKDLAESEIRHDRLFALMSDAVLVQLGEKRPDAAALSASGPSRRRHGPR